MRRLLKKILRGFVSIFCPKVLEAINSGCKIEQVEAIIDKETEELMPLWIR